KLASPESIEKEIEALSALGGSYIVFGEKEYPALLSETEDAPIMLSVLGSREVLSKEAVALVGARHASAGGVRMAYGLAENLSSAGMVVVSGLARGIDTAAHKGVLTASEGAGTI